MCIISSTQEIVSIRITVQASSRQKGRTLSVTIAKIKKDRGMAQVVGRTQA
jgi:hypothetical protein